MIALHRAYFSRQFMVFCILGAGVAGLWLHNRLNAAGITSVLLDIHPMGSAQSLSAQGIIHGGAKYNLSGVTSRASESIAGMPDRWRNCIIGSGDVDLTGVKILAENQLMWSAQSLGAKMTHFLSSKVVKNKVSYLKGNSRPDFFNSERFSGNVYGLNEPVLDVYSVLQSLSQPYQHLIFNPPNYQIICDKKGQVVNIDFPNGISLPIDRLVLSAGEGNEALLQQLGLKKPVMQRRPLHMVLFKSAQLWPLYAHCIGANNKPLLTITSHQHSDGDWVWYIGGNIAEEGVARSDEEQILAAKVQLEELLYWVDLPSGHWATHRVIRAEPKQKTLIRPDTGFGEWHQNIFVAWPTKLALAPTLADKIMKNIDHCSEAKEKINSVFADLQKDYPAIMALPLCERIFP